MFLLFVPYWNLSGLYLGGDWFFLRSAVSPTRLVLQSTGSFGDWGVSLTRPVLESNSSFDWRAVSLTRLELDSRRSVLGEFG